jgi:signal transduction histidine kinase
MAAERNAPSPSDRFLSLVAKELDQAIVELREIVWAGGSAGVSRRGLGASLRSVTRAAPTAVHVLDRGLQRSHPQAELAVYYCCLEALQNAIKHAGRDVPVTIRLSDAPQGGISFSVIDSGSGFVAEEQPTGVGLRTMHDRVETLGGWLRVTSAPDLGTVVSGWVPSQPLPPEMRR